MQRAVARPSAILFGPKFGRYHSQTHSQVLQVLRLYIIAARLYATLLSASLRGSGLVLLRADLFATLPLDVDLNSRLTPYAGPENNMRKQHTTCNRPHYSHPTVTGSQGEGTLGIQRVTLTRHIVTRHVVTRHIDTSHWHVSLGHLDDLFWFPSKRKPPPPRLCLLRFLREGFCHGHRNVRRLLRRFRRLLRRPCR